MFKDHNVIPAQFNVICKPIQEISAQKSDKNNGYFIVSGLWGSCFFRISTQKDRFEILQNSNPRCPHTYTKIPAHLAPKTFFLYVNYKVGYNINLPNGAILVGMHEAQPHKTGGWWSQSAIIYSPTGEAPTAIETDTQVSELGIMVTTSKKETIITTESIMQGFPIRFIAVNEEGYYAYRNTRGSM